MRIKKRALIYWLPQRLLFGRDGIKSDFVMLLEPIEPRHIYAENHRKSMNISARHLEIGIQNRHAYIQDTSSNGTHINGDTLVRGQRSLLKKHLK